MACTSPHSQSQGCFTPRMLLSAVFVKAKEPLADRQHTQVGLGEEEQIGKENHSQPGIAAPSAERIAGAG